MKFKSKYPILKNIGFALKNIWKWDKGFYFITAMYIPIRILFRFVPIYFPKVIIETFQMAQDMQRMVIVISAFCVVQLLINTLRLFFYSKISIRKNNYSILYQHEISKKFMRTDFSNTDNPEQNIKYSHAMEDAKSGRCAPGIIGESLQEFFFSAIGIFTYGTIIATISPVALVYMVGATVVTYFIGRWQRNYIEKNKNGWIVIDRKINYLSGFSHKFEYAKDIRVYGMYDWIKGMFDGLQKRRFQWTKKVSLRSFIGRCIGALVTMLREGVTYVILITMILEKELAAGDFVFFSGVILGFSGWLNGIAGQVSDIVHTSIKIGYYREYFEMKDRYNYGKGCDLPEKREWPVEIEFSGVSYCYPSATEGKRALKNINLKIKKGEKLAIVGLNGAGKTTLVKLLCGFYYPTAGEILLNGIPVREYNIEEYYTLFSAVFQDVFLLPVTIAEFVASSDKKINRERVNWAIRQSGLEEKVKLLPKGIDTRLMKGIYNDSMELSGGEKQKMLLARALYKEAPVIVLDEPSSALDPIAESELYLKYNELSENKTVIFISHRLASTRFCDRIIYMDMGEIQEYGTHDELMKLGGKYANMFDVQSKYYKEM